jgi:hypothetical protein
VLRLNSAADARWVRGPAQIKVWNVVSQLLGASEMPRFQLVAELHTLLATDATIAPATISPCVTALLDAKMLFWRDPLTTGGQHAVGEAY